MDVDEHVPVEVEVKEVTVRVWTEVLAAEISGVVIEIEPSAWVEVKEVMVWVEAVVEWHLIL